jgi:murein DD-endopeptidase MepM/ murein hydrolase activator NlpD
LLNATVGVQRVVGRLRRPSHPRPATAAAIRARSRAAADHLQNGVHSVAAASRLVPTRERTIVADRPVVADRSVAAQRRSILGRLGTDRAVAVAVAGILLGASVVSITAGHPAANTGGTTGGGTAPRIAVGGGTGVQRDDVDLADRSDGTTSTGDTRGADRTGTVQLGAPDPTLTTGLGFESIDLGDGVAAETQTIDVEGPFTEDGTLVKPIAVDTTVPDGSDLVQTYTVKAGDTLAGIAAKYRVSMMSVWWANNLKSKTDLHKGQQLRIPPVTGLIVTVAATDTLDELAAKYNVNSEDILATNGLDDPNLVVGQVLVVPGAKGRSMPVPKPASKPASRPSNGSSGVSHVGTPARYTGGAFLWPVIGGCNYISQYFHYGHYAIDIAADYGSTVRAAAAGTVIFSGWKNNGGGYQVWIAHGSGLYTTYNHMSSLSVGRGEHVGRGDHVGRVGQTGNATGPHLHFEVWRGPVWDGGTRVNPLAYF